VQQPRLSVVMVQRRRTQRGLSGTQRTERTDGTAERRIFKPEKKKRIDRPCNERTYRQEPSPRLL